MRLVFVFFASLVTLVAAASTWPVEGVVKGPLEEMQILLQGDEGQYVHRLH